MAALVTKRTRIAADLAKLEESGETQLSRTDPDARLLSKSGQVVSGYNVQIAVDDKHKLIVASAVVNDGNDTGQLHAIAVEAKQNLNVATLRATAVKNGNRVIVDTAPPYIRVMRETLYHVVCRCQAAELGLCRRHVRMSYLCQIEMSY